MAETGQLMHGTGGSELQNYLQPNAFRFEADMAGAHAFGVVQRRSATD